MKAAPAFPRRSSRARRPKTSPARPTNWRVRDGRKKVTIVHKASVMMQSDGLFRRVALEVGAQFPQIITEELLVDTAAYWMVKDPTRFDVILTPNLYGDILSDMAAAWGGGLGLAPSLSIGDGVALAEPVHGCAPDIAGKGIANPTATIMSAAMLLRHHWQRNEAALSDRECGARDAAAKARIPPTFTRKARFRPLSSPIKFVNIWDNV